jgi:hypothetical protein
MNASLVTADAINASKRDPLCIKPGSNKWIAEYNTEQHE